MLSWNVLTQNPAAMGFAGPYLANTRNHIGGIHTESMYFDATISWKVILGLIAFAYIKRVGLLLQ